MRVQRTTPSVGPALRKVREGRGVTLEEAARDMRVRREFLEAIEAEHFDHLLGDVHVRGCLRTYATYLRLSPDKVVAVYETEHPQTDEGTTITTPPPRTEPVLGARRRRDDHRLWILVAAVVLVVAGAFGILSARRPAPAPANLSGAESGSVVAASELAQGITVAVEARVPIEVSIVADGGRVQPFSLEAGEGRSFHGDTSVWIRLSDGRGAKITVNGVSKGFPGKAGKPWHETYSYDETTSGG
jgi:cytoskeletal protein RodZ